MAPREVLKKAGWSRSVGGSNPYLTLFSRAGTSRSAAEQAAADLEIHELPSARGCTYVVSRDDFALALTLSQPSNEAGDYQVLKRHLGVQEEELMRLADGVLRVLEEGPLDPAEIRVRLGDAVRNLGPDGKKRGVTTTLPPVLGRLQSLGHLRRVPVGGRLDQQRYAYVLWKNGPLAKEQIPLDEAYRMLAEKFFRWIGPASVAHFQWFSGLGVKASKAVVASIGVVPIEDGSDLLIHEEDLDAFHEHRVPEEPQVTLVGSIDSIALHRRDLVSLLAPEDYLRKMPGEKAIYEVGHVQDLSNHAIFDRGRIVGLWEYDPDAKEIVWASFIEPNEAIRHAVARMEAFIRDQLGDARSFSLDSPESRRPRLEILRSLGR